MASFKSLNNRKFKTAIIPEVFELGKKGFHAGLKAPAQCKEVMLLLKTGNALDILGSWNKGWHSEQMRKANESLVGFFS